MDVNLADFAKLIKKCAFEMTAEDHIINKQWQCNVSQICSVPSFRGEEVCEDTARGASLEPLGKITYLLLIHSWNDALDWADANGAGPG